MQVQQKGLSSTKKITRKKHHLITIAIFEPKRYFLPNLTQMSAVVVLHRYLI